jgi:hypothetical protein
MHTHSDVSSPLPIPLQPLLGAISRVWHSTAKRVRSSREIARPECVVSRLAAHLRYDIGDLDCRPLPPLPPQENQNSHQQSLEAMWLRYLN